MISKKLHGKKRLFSPPAFLLCLQFHATSKRLWKKLQQNQLLSKSKILEGPISLKRSCFTLSLGRKMKKQTHLGWCTHERVACQYMEVWEWRVRVQGWQREPGGSAQGLRVALAKHTCTQTHTHQHCIMMLYNLKTNCHCSWLTGGFGRFFLLVVDLEPENRRFKAASAALALATFLFGPVPRNICLSTSTCHNTQNGPLYISTIFLTEKCALTLK